LSITSEPGRRDVRAKLAAYSALLAERKSSLQTYYASQETFFKTRSPSDADQDAALAAFARTRPQMDWIYNGLDSAQSNEMTTMSAIVDWAASQGGTLRVSNGKFLFANETQQAEAGKLI